MDELREDKLLLTFVLLRFESAVVLLTFFFLICQTTAQERGKATHSVCRVPYESCIGKSFIGSLMKR